MKIKSRQLSLVSHPGLVSTAVDSIIDANLSACFVKCSLMFLVGSELELGTSVPHRVPPHWNPRTSMSMSGGVMSNVALDAALDELGMLSTVTNSRQQFLLERDRQYHLAALDIPQDLDIRPRNTNGGMRTRASSVSIINGKRAAKTKFPSMRYAGSQPSVDRIIQASRSGRIRRTQMENLSFCSSNELPNLDPVPYIALPIESSLSSNLFKSRSMESIDARTSDDSVCATERECLSSTIANLAEVDSVSSGLNRLNVNE